ncbi:MAG: formyltransferase family protein [bacterium]|nr:formyltransferase family protein [bacterium]
MKEHFPKIAVLISNKGTGSNLQAVIDAQEREEIDVELALVVSDRLGAQGLERAEKHNIPYIVMPYISTEMAREEYGKKLAEYLNANDIKIAVLAGFMTILPPNFFEIYDGQVFNVHPGLIPDSEDGIFKFPDGSDAPWNRGLMTDKAVENFIGLNYAGSTWHIATEKTDFGPVLKRVIVEVLPEDTLDILYGRLKQKEHEALIEILKDGKILSRV